MLPAYAGMIRFAIEADNIGASAPRVCGDDPCQNLVGAINKWCSPRMRG